MLVTEFHHPASQDGLPQEREYLGIDWLPRSGPRGQPLDLHQGLEIGLSPFRRSVAPGGAQLGADFFQLDRLFLQAGLFEGGGGGAER